MLARHKQLVGSYERVQAFLVANPPPNAAPAFAAGLASLGEVIDRLNALLSDQVEGAKERLDDTGRIQQAMRALREKHLAPVSQIAKAVLVKDPAVRKALAMPDARFGAKRLLAEATGFRSSAAKHAQRFVDAGRPADFLERLDAAIEAVRAAMVTRGASHGQHVGARAGLPQELAAARQIVMQLDVIVREAFAGDLKRLAQWKLAKRVRLVGTRSRAVAAAQQPAA